MQTKKRMQTYDEISSEEVKNALAEAVALVERNLSEFTDRFPGPCSKGQFYMPGDNLEWTTGFWTGEIWLSYEYTKDEKFKEAGLVQVESFLERIKKRIQVDHHDMGFLYSPSCVAAYKLVGSENGKKAALLAADNLMKRFHEKGKFFQAWGELGAKDNYRLIIDCLLNMPLLFWATSVTGDDSYAIKAEEHIKTAMELVIRPDCSTYHTYFFNPETGEPTIGVTCQGNRDGSAWARGQAWGIYGSALSYARIKNPYYVETFKKVSDFFIEHLPEDLIPYWDFDFEDGSGEPKDSSAAAIAACGFLEMSKYLSEEEAEYYTGAARKLMKPLAERYAVKKGMASNGLLSHGVYARKTATNTCNNSGVDECNTWGDYFYMEALVRLSKDWELYW